MAMQRKGRGFQLTERDKAVLKAFRACRVPNQYFSLDGRGNTKYDFNFNYEEVYDYADALLRGEEISLEHNFVGLRAGAINEDFRKVLEVLGRRDPVLEDFCDKLSQAISVIERAGK